MPYFDNGYYYYSRYESGKEYAIHCRKKDSLSGPEEIILDENILADGFDYFAVGGRRVSPDNKWLALGRPSIFSKLLASMDVALRSPYWTTETANVLVRYVLTALSSLLVDSESNKDRFGSLMIIRSRLTGSRKADSRNIGSKPVYAHAYTHQDALSPKTRRWHPN